MDVPVQVSDFIVVERLFTTLFRAAEIVPVLPAPLVPVKVKLNHPPVAMVNMLGCIPATPFVFTVWSSVETTAALAIGAEIKTAAAK